MYTLRCTAPLLGRFKNDPRLVALADANRLNVGHQRLILCSSELSLLSMILPAKDLHQLPQRLGDAIAVLLELLDVPPKVVADEFGQMESVQVDRTASRVVLGSMTDFTHMAKAYFRDGMPLGGVVRCLSECPCSPLGYANPADKARELLRRNECRSQRR